MNVISRLVFIVKYALWGSLLGLLVLFFMPGSKLPFNFQMAREMVSFYKNYQQNQQLSKNGRDAPSLSIDNFSFAEAVKKASPSVVSVYVYRPKGLRASSQLPPNQRIFDVSVGIGSGVILSNDGYIVTNYHVIEKAEKISIGLADDRKRFVELVGYDRETDIAVLKTELTGLESAALGSSGELRQGDLVMAIGSPFGSAQSVSLGIVSAITFDLPSNKIQTDAAINSGNSGGALINVRGEVVGINQMILSSRGGGQTGVNYALPIDFVNKIAEDIIQHGHVRRNMFGVTAGELSAENYRQFFPEVESGVGIVVESIEPGSPAAAAQLQMYDLLTRFDGKKIEGLGSFYEIFYNTPLGKQVEIELVRDGKPLKLIVQLREKQVTQ